MNEKLINLIQALNIQGINVALTRTTKYNRNSKQIYYKSQLTIWEKKIINHKAKYVPVFNESYRRISDMIIFLAKLVNNDDLSAMIKQEKIIRDAYNKK
jgi:anion-transporting  ArsA/GET3 family ATPase